jgi:hypothetical protein
METDMRGLQATSMTDSELLNYCEIHWDQLEPEYLKELIKRMARYMETHIPDIAEPKDERQLPLF